MCYNRRMKNDNNLLDLINEDLLTPERKTSLYDNSPFKSFVGLPPKTKGSIYEKIVRSVCSKLGGLVLDPLSSDHDMLFEGEKYEIKGAMLDAQGKGFTFNQIRPDQDYDYILFACFYPDGLYMLVMDKSRSVELCDSGVFKKQHGGNKADSRTYIYKGTAEDLVSLGAHYMNYID